MSRDTDNDDIEFVDAPPPRGEAARDWWNVLLPLTKHKNRWARVAVYDTPPQAQSAQSNLHRRRSHIPKPEDKWEFASRGCELFAIYRGGQARGSSSRTQRGR